MKYSITLLLGLIANVLATAAYAAEPLAPPKLDIYVDINAWNSFYDSSDVDSSVGHSITFGFVSNSNKKPYRAAWEFGFINLGQDDFGGTVRDVISTNDDAFPFTDGFTPGPVDRTTFTETELSLGGFHLGSKIFFPGKKLTPYAGLGLLFYQEKTITSPTVTFDFLDLSANPVSRTIVRSSLTKSKSGLGYTATGGALYKLSETIDGNLSAQYFSGDQLKGFSVGLGLKKTF